MKPHPPILRQLVLESRQQGKSAGAIARELSMPIGTVKCWLFSRHSTMDSTTQQAGEMRQNATTHATGAWMQSLHHESAHFVTNGHTACENAQNGARVVAGMTWFPHNGCLRKCQRCMKHATAQTAS